MKKTPKGEISIDNKDYKIYTNIEGMCIQLKKSLKDTLIASIQENNFYPYVDKDGKHGFFLRQSNGTFKTLSNINWKNILNGTISKLRPKENMPPNNRVHVHDNESNQKIETCYWPDHYFESQTKNTKKKTLTKNNIVNDDSTLKIDGDPNILSKFIKKATMGTSFEFLKSIEPHALCACGGDPQSISHDQIVKTNLIYEMDLNDTESFTNDLNQVFTNTINLTTDNILINQSHHSENQSTNTIYQKQSEEEEEKEKLENDIDQYINDAISKLNTNNEPNTSIDNEKNSKTSKLLNISKQTNTLTSYFSRGNASAGNWRVLPTNFNSTKSATSNFEKRIITDTDKHLQNTQKPESFTNKITKKRKHADIYLFGNDTLDNYLISSQNEKDISVSPNIKRMRPNKSC